MCLGHFPSSTLLLPLLLRSPLFLSPEDKERGRYQNVGSGHLWTTKRSIKFTTPQFLSANLNREGEKPATAGQVVTPPHFFGPPADVSFRPRSHPNRPIPRCVHYTFSAKDMATETTFMRPGAPISRAY